MVKTKRIAICGLLIAVAFVLMVVESFIPLNFAVPGIKLGLANIVVVFALYTLDVKTSAIIAAIKAIMSGVLFSSATGVLFSALGGLLSYLAMFMLIKGKVFSPIGVSITGAVLHIIGQLTMAAIVLSTWRIIFYLPMLLISSLITGAINGIIVKAVLGKIK